MVKPTFEHLPVAKKSRIQQALLDEFSHYPLPQAQVARIVKQANIARGAFYQYFDNLTDAYQYSYRLALCEIHTGISFPATTFEPQVYYEQVVAFVQQAQNSRYRQLIKFHLGQNQSLLTEAPTWQARMRKLDARTWAAAGLSHDMIKLALFDPEHQTQNLARFKQSLELIKGD